MRNSNIVLASLLVAAAIAIAPSILPPYDMRILNLALINAVGALGLTFAFGYAGLIHLGPAAFTGIGAYASAFVAMRLGLPPGAAIVLSAGAGLLVALALGLPLLRLRRHYLALATMGLVVTFEVVAKNWDSVTGGMG